MKHILTAFIISFSLPGPVSSSQEITPFWIPSDTAGCLHGESTPSAPVPCGVLPSTEPTLLLDRSGGQSLAFRDTAAHPPLQAGGDDVASADSARSDSLRRAMVRRLLPPHLSLLESGLWGERGILRSPGLFGPLMPESRKKDLSLRRTMLTLHQVGGFVTLGLMATTVYFGQMALDNPRTRSYRETHSDFVGLTIVSYSLTGALALLSPPPLIRRDEFSTTELHKILAWVHVVGMIVTPILGASLEHSLSYDQRARFHQLSAYITTATFATAMIVITF
jgi:hypothetical protein